MRFMAETGVRSQNPESRIKAVSIQGRFFLVSGRLQNRAGGVKCWLDRRASVRLNLKSSESHRDTERHRENHEGKKMKASDFSINSFAYSSLCLCVSVAIFN